MYIAASRAALVALVLLSPLTLLAPSAAEAACDVKIDFDTFDEALTAAESAYAENRADMIDKNMGEAYRALECLEYLITPPRAARFHGVAAMHAWSQARFSLARLALMAARAADKEYKLPEVLKDDDPMREALLVTRTVTPSRQKIPAPASGSFRFDGVTALDRPGELPTVYQKLDPLGKPRIGAYVWPDQDLPPYTLLKQTKKPLFGK